jgi:deoxyribonuclease V
MHIRELHKWPHGRSEALKIQHQFKSRVELNGSLDEVKLIAGVETAFDHIANILYAAVCLYTHPDLVEQERATASATATFPYIPGLHAFREGPVILRAFSRLHTESDLVMFAAHGIAHPRRFGMASHLGVILDLPSVGCARKLLVGEHDEVGDTRGSSAPLMLNADRVGTVYRSRDGVKPIFISPGHRCTVDAATEMVVSTLREYRIPEPLRAAHRLANRLKHAGEKRK